MPTQFERIVGSKEAERFRDETRRIARISAALAVQAAYGPVSAETLLGRPPKENDGAHRIDTEVSDADEKS